MKFGALSIEELEQADLSLPSDHSRTAEILKSNNRKGDPKVYVGCAKWGRKEWVGQIYPEGTKDKDFLSEYVKNFNAIELNGTFYNAKRSNVEAWTEIAPGGFKFSPKFSRFISHIKRLKNTEENTEYFVDTMSLMGDNLGLCFLQLPENFSPKYFERLKDYLELIPQDFPLAIELRQEDWFKGAAFDETCSLFEETGKSLVITDVAGRRDCVHQRLTIPAVFIRFNGYDLHQSDYNRLDAWAQRIKEWIELGINDVYFYCHQQDEVNTPVISDYFINKINDVCDLNLARPHFIK